MGGDYSRHRFDPRADFANLFEQQGRVTLDADRNALAEIVERRIRAETVDIIGRSVVPRETEHGFEIALAGSGASQMLMIGGGRIYVDGLLAENHGTGPRLFDMADRTNGRMEGVLAEEIGKNAIPFTNQPYRPEVTVPTGPDRYLVYLDVWRREVTYLEDGGLLESALGGVDTTTREQTVWQVKTLEEIGDADCGSFESDRSWLDIVRPSAARLTTSITPPQSSNDPCLLPPQAGYRGLQNQFYRIEIHQPGGAGVATFKWSRDNASIATNVIAVTNTGTGPNAIGILTVVRTGRDAVLRFNAGDWVEITDDIRELNGKPGEMRQIKTVDDAARQIVLKGGLPAGLTPTDAADAAQRHLRICRWDQSGIVYDTGGAQFWDVDAHGGTIRLPPAGTKLVLEHGIEIAFNFDLPGNAHSGDHWTFAARTADASIEILNQAPPRGIHHHFARLAIVDPAAPEVIDCRTLWPGDCCGCTVCVTPESHTSGRLTIQAAIDKVKAAGGGTVCLEIGRYKLKTGLVIDQCRSLRLLGQGFETILEWDGDGEAVKILHSSDVTAEAFAVVHEEETVQGVAIRVKHSQRVSIHRCAVTPAPVRGGYADGTAVVLEGEIAAVSITQNTFFVSICIEVTDGGDGAIVGLPGLIVRDNLLTSDICGIQVDPDCEIRGKVQIARNCVTANGAGIKCYGKVQSGGQAHVEIAKNMIRSRQDGISVGCNSSTIDDNDVSIVAGGTGDAIVLKPANPGQTVGDCRIVGNRLSYGGIAIRGRIGTVMIKQNIIRDAAIGVCMFEKWDAPSVDPSGIPTFAGELLCVENNRFEKITARTDMEYIAAIAAQHVQELQVLANTIFVVDSSAIPNDGIMVDQCVTVQINENTITDIATDKERVAAIEVRAGTAVQIAGNAIARIGVQGSTDVFGIRVRDCVNTQILGNTLDELGGESESATATGISVVAPTLSLQIADNRVCRTLADERLQPAEWYAINVDPDGTNTSPDDHTGTPGTDTSSTSSAPVDGHASHSHADVDADALPGMPGGTADRMDVAGEEMDVERHFPADELAEVRDMLPHVKQPNASRLQVGVLGNHCTVDGTRVPVIRVKWVVGGCTFSNNQCHRRHSDPKMRIVSLEGNNVAISGNVIRDDVRAPSIRFTTASYTALGNVTTGRIYPLGQIVLPAPWQALNVMMSS